MVRSIAIKILFLVFLRLGIVNGQGIAFQKTIGGNSFDFGVDVVELPNKDFCILGSSSSYSTSNDLLLWILDSLGNYKHHVLLGENDVDNACAIDFKGDTIFVLGTSISPGTGNYDISFYSLKSDGTIIFQKRYDFSNWEYATSLVRTSANGFLISGNSYVDEFNQTDGFILSVDSIGQVLFYRNYGNSGLDSIANCLEANGYFYTIGTFTDPVNQDKEIWVLKIDTANGNIADEVFFGANYDDYGQSILLKSNGEIVIGGVSNSFFNPGANFNYFFHSVNQNLATVWPQEQVSNTNFEWKSIRSMRILPNDELVFLGNIELSGNKDFLVYKLNNQGYFNGGTTFGTYGEEFGGRLFTTADSGFIFCATTKGVYPGLENIYVQKNDADFLFNPQASIEVGIDNSLSESTGITIFPNPVESELFITSIGSIIKIEIYDCLGRNITSENNNPFSSLNINYSVIDIRNFNPGSYYLKIFEKERLQPSQHKFIILDH